MPIGPFGITGVALGLGGGALVSGRVGEMTLARYGVAAAGGGLMLGPRDSDTRRGARLGAGVGAAGTLGWNIYQDYGAMAKAYARGAAPEGAADILARTAATATERAARTAGVPMTVGNEARKTLERTLAPLVEGEGAVAKVLRSRAGMAAVSQEIGGITKYGVSKALKGGAWGAVVGAAALGAYGVVSGGAHIKSNEPMY